MWSETLGVMEESQKTARTRGMLSRAWVMERSGGRTQKGRVRRQARRPKRMSMKYSPFNLVREILCRKQLEDEK